MSRGTQALLVLLLLGLVSGCGDGGSDAPGGDVGVDAASVPDGMGEPDLGAPDGGGAVDGAVDGAAGDAAPDAAADTGGGAADAGDAADGADPSDAGGPVCDPRVLGAGEVRAKVVACADELVAGPHAAGRMGDLLLENDRVRFVVRAGSEGHALLGTSGGGVVDAARVGADGAVDGLRELLPTVSLNVLATEDVSVAADGAGGEAVVRVTGRAVPLSLLADILPPQEIDGVVTVEYVLRPDTAQLVVRTRVAVPADGRTSRVAAAEVLFLAGDQRLFRHGAGAGADVSWNGPFLATAGPGVSYGLVADGNVNYVDYTGALIFLAPGVAVLPGTEHVIERTFVVGDGSVSSVTDATYALRGTETGPVRVTLTGVPAGDCLHAVRAYDTRDRVLSEIAACPGVPAEAWLPLGDVRLIAGCDGCADGEPTVVSVTADGVAAADVAGSPAGRVTVTVRESGGPAPDGRVIPARLTIEDLDHPEARRLLRFSGPAPRDLLLAPGRYRVTATRGFEYEQATQELDVAAGAGATLDLTLARSVPTPGAVAAEFHIHSENSADAAVPLPDRALSCAAEGLEFVVATDHDFVTDYGPIVTALGLTPFLATAPGVEISSIDAGHTQAWPILPDRDFAGDGAPVWFGLSPPDLVALARAMGAAIVQVNHPRYDYGSAFEIIQFDPVTGRALADPALLGFAPDTDLNALPYDAMEVFNGIGDEQLGVQLADWYALLNQGRRMTATAGGDSHDLGAYPGNPRNFVVVADDTPTALTVQEIAAAVRDMRVLVSAGPYVEAGVVVGDAVAQPGDVVTVTGGSATLRVRVQAASWVAVDEVRVVAGGAVVETVDLRGDPPDGVLRLARDLDVPVAADTWIVVIAEGAARDPIGANHAPFAITNPIWIDADGDGAFTPAGAGAR